MAKRTLHRPQAVTVACLACNWRQFTNKSFKELLKLEGNTIPADFTGILVGYMNGSITVVNFQNGKQIGYAPIPLGNVEYVVNRIGDIYDAQMTELMEGMKRANDDEAGDDESVSEAQSDDDEDYASDDEVARMLAKILARDGAEALIEGDEDDVAEALSELRELVSAEDDEE